MSMFLFTHIWHFELFSFYICLSFISLVQRNSFIHSLIHLNGLHNSNDNKLSAWFVISLVLLFSGIFYSFFLESKKSVFHFSSSSSPPPFVRHYFTHTHSYPVFIFGYYVICKKKNLVPFENFFFPFLSCFPIFLFRRFLTTTTTTTKRT